MDYGSNKRGAISDLPSCSTGSLDGVSGDRVLREVLGVME